MGCVTIAEMKKQERRNTAECKEYSFRSRRTGRLFGMKCLEGECCGCASPGYPCVGEICKFRNVPHYYCDKCKQEFEPEELYCMDDEELCVDCLLLNFKSVKQEEMEGNNG